MTRPDLQVSGVSVEFQRGEVGRRSARERVVRDLSFEIESGEVFGLVGESGSGKSTTARAILRLIPLSGGVVQYKGIDIGALKERELRALRRDMQIVFQDPSSSMNPRMRLGDFVGEPLRVHERLSRSRAYAEAQDLLEQVGLEGSMVARFPHECSGGQRQRAVIARAIATQPSFLILDEAVSALDVSIQAEILNLISELRSARGLTYLFISHDLAVVRLLSDRVGVMYLGRLVEVASVTQLFSAPRHPYTIMLLRAVPVIGVEMETAQLPATELDVSAIGRSGCEFRDRCWLYKELDEPLECRTEDPHVGIDVRLPAWSACHFASLAEAHEVDRRLSEKRTAIEANSE